MREWASEGHADGVSRGRRGLLEGDDGRRDQRVGELHVRWAETVDVSERHVLGEIGLQSRPVVYVHELGRDQPDGEPSVGQPGVGE